MEKEGEEEYDEAFLKEHHTTMITVEDQDDLTAEKLRDWELMYNPSRVLLEWNGMWDLAGLELPNDWGIYQQMALD